MSVVLATVLVSAVVVSACGGGGGSSTSVVARTKQLLGSVFAKLTGGKIGQIQAEVKQLTDQLSELSGTALVDGVSFDLKTTVDADNNFYLVADNITPSAGGGSTVLSSLSLSGKLVAPLVAGDPVTIDGTWSADLPKPGGTPGETLRSTGTIVAASSGSGTGTGAGTGTLPGAGTCEWSPTAFYNEQQVVTFQGRGYTARQAVAPLGAAAAALVNPASDSFDWTPGGTCGPTPFVTVETAICTKGTAADVIVMTGTAYGGGIGDAIASYTSVTDRSFSTENSFGLWSTQYSMSCRGGGFVGTFASNTSPSYSLCVKTQASSDATQWTSTQTVAHTTTRISDSVAYASKGNPLRATVFSVGAIVLGFDAVRSAGVAITGNCD